MLVKCLYWSVSCLEMHFESRGKGRRGKHLKAKYRGVI